MLLSMSQSGRKMAIYEHIPSTLLSVPEQKYNRRKLHYPLTVDATVFHLLRCDYQWNKRAMSGIFHLFPFVCFFFKSLSSKVNYSSPEQCLAGLQIFQGSKSRGQGVRVMPWAQLEILSVLLLSQACSQLLAFSRSVIVSLSSLLCTFPVCPSVSHSHFFLTPLFNFSFSLVFSSALYVQA